MLTTRQIRSNNVARPPKILAKLRSSQMPSTIDNATARAQLSYGQKPADGKSFFYYYMKGLPEGVQQRTRVALEDCETSFIDLRSVSQPFTLPRNGFAIETLHNFAECSWDDSNQVMSCSRLHTAATQFFSRRPRHEHLVGPPACTLYAAAAEFRVKRCVHCNFELKFNRQCPADQRQVLPRGRSSDQEGYWSYQGTGF